MKASCHILRGRLSCFVVVPARSSVQVRCLPQCVHMELMSGSWQEGAEAMHAHSSLPAGLHAETGNLSMKDHPMLVFAAPRCAHEQRARSPTGKWGGIGLARFRCGVLTVGEGDLGTAGGGESERPGAAAVSQSVSRFRRGPPAAHHTPPVSKAGSVTAARWVTCVSFSVHRLGQLGWDLGRSHNVGQLTT